MILLPHPRLRGEEHQALAMRYGPYRAAKLEGKKFAGKKKGAGAGKQVHSTFGVGFDNQAEQKETVQDLEKRLNSEAFSTPKGANSLGHRVLAATSDERRGGGVRCDAKPMPPLSVASRRTAWRR